MDLFEVDVDGPLVVIRAIHFAATAILAGVLIFRTVVVEPLLHSEEAIANTIREQILGVAWFGLAIAMVSGAIWVLVQASAMSGLPFVEAASSEVLSTVLNETQFGFVSEVRFVLALILAACLVYDRLPLTRGLALVPAITFIAAIAWTGHAGSTSGQTGILHLASDMSHLLAAAAWIGGLVPFVLLFGTARSHRASGQQALAWTALEKEIAQRFSTLGLISVGTLVATGIINAGILVGSLRGLLVSEYGQLLMLKLVVFAVMLGFAAVNRYWLTPRLVPSPKCAVGPEILRQLLRNSVIEIALGLAVFAIVGVLGTLHPAAHSL
jgi:putative copper resistance protein D